MKIKSFSTLFFMSILFVCYSSSSYAQDEAFKNIFISIQKAMFNEMNYPENPEYKITEKKLNQWKTKLSEEISDYPNSAWSDDALYVSSVLSSGAQEKTQLLERLIDEYPGMNFEQWVKESLTYLVPDITMDLDVRMQLLDLYYELEEKDKLLQLCETSITLYPKKSKLFETYIRKLNL